MNSIRAIEKTSNTLVMRLPKSPRAVMDISAKGVIKRLDPKKEKSRDKRSGAWHEEQTEVDSTGEGGMTL
jgi:hypothetical protein